MYWFLVITYCELPADLIRRLSGPAALEPLRLSGFTWFTGFRPTECVHKRSKRCDLILPFQPFISATPIIPVAQKFTAASRGTPCDSVATCFILEWIAPVNYNRPVLYRINIENAGFNASMFTSAVKGHAHCWVLN